MKRSPENCPYREENPDIDVGSSCNFIAKLTKLRSGAHPTRVGRDVCRACCQHDIPTLELTNPVVASRLFHAAQFLRDQSGEENHSRVAKIESLAIRNMERIRPNPRAVSESGKVKSCAHLGEYLELRACETCNGNVRLKVFACRHPNHVDTTIRGCHYCPDFVAADSDVPTESPTPRTSPTLAE